MDICDQINEISFELRMETIINIEIVSIRNSSEISLISSQKKKKNLMQREYTGTRFVLTPVKLTCAITFFIKISST